MAKCFSPLSIPRPNGRGNTDRISVPCGKCAACDLNRIEEFKNRAIYEYRHCDNAFFITLTYDEENLPYDKNYGVPVLVKFDYQGFLKRMRKSIKRDVSRVDSALNNVSKWLKMRYIFCGEYGPQNNRPHYHAVLFNIPIPPGMNGLIYVLNLVNESWGKGFVNVGMVKPGAIDYVVSYILGKRNHKYPWQPPFMEASRRPGIGFAYVENMKKWHQDREDEFMMQIGNGEKKKMPRYLQKKIFSPQAIERIADKKYLYAREEERKLFEERFSADSVRFLGFCDYERAKHEEHVKRKQKLKSKLPGGSKS